MPVPLNFPWGGVSGIVYVVSTCPMYINRNENEGGARSTKSPICFSPSTRGSFVLRAMADDGMDPTQYYHNRLGALAAQKAAGVNPYPHAFQPTV